MMLPAEESIKNLKLWSVNKNFQESMNTAVQIQSESTKATIGKLNREITNIDSGKSYGILKDLPDLEARKAMMLDKRHIDAIRQIKAPSDAIEKIMALWLLMLDSFGFDVIPKVLERIADVQKAGKDQRAALFAKGVWPTVLS